MTLKEFLLKWEGCENIKTVQEAFRAAVLTEEEFDALVAEIVMYPTIAPFTPVDAAIEEIEQEDGYDDSI
jgi:hypothetical protein